MFAHPCMMILCFSTRWSEVLCQWIVTSLSFIRYRTCFQTFVSARGRIILITEVKSNKHICGLFKSTPNISDAPRFSIRRTPDDRSSVASEQLPGPPNTMESKQPDQSRLPAATPTYVPILRRVSSSNGSQLLVDRPRSSASIPGKTRQARTRCCAQLLNILSRVLKLGEHSK